MKRLRDRNTGDILVLMIAFTVCGYIIVISAVLIVNAFINPNEEQTGAARNIADIINTLIGLLAGYLAGRSGFKSKDGGEEDEPPT